MDRGHCLAVLAFYKKLEPWNIPEFRFQRRTGCASEVLHTAEDREEDRLKIESFGILFFFSEVHVLEECS